MPMPRATRTPATAIIAVCILSSIAISTSANATISTVAPFTGQFTDTFNEYSTVMAVQSLPVFGGLGTLQNLTPGGAIKVEFSSLFDGVQIVPLSGMMAGQLGIGQWTFSQPITRFGGWFANNSGQNDATVTFYDAQNQLQGQMIATIPFAPGWTWNGWSSDVPITRIVVTGNGVLNGFLWYENMQVDTVPGPPAVAALALVALMRMSKKRRRLDSQHSRVATRP